MKRTRKNSISYYVLSALEKTAEGIFIDGISYSAQMRSLWGIPPKTKKSSVVEAIRRLKNKGIIERKVINDGRVILKLSALGIDYFSGKEEWDGKYRIVVWDIPEKSKRVRNLFRRRLKEWDFKLWQKSVWVGKRNVTERLRNLISELGMKKYVAVIETDDPFLSSLT
jgi:DNA-binding transcriptional regulator PaaX